MVKQPRLFPFSPTVHLPPRLEGQGELVWPAGSLGEINAGLHCLPSAVQLRLSVRSSRGSRQAREGEEGRDQ